MILPKVISTKTQGEDPFNRHKMNCTLQTVTSMIQLDKFSYEQLIHKALHCNLYFKSRSQLHLATQPKGHASPKTIFIAALVYPTHVEDQDYHKTEIIMCSKIATSNSLNEIMNHILYESLITSPLLVLLFFHEFPFFTLYAHVLFFNFLSANMADSALVHNCCVTHFCLFLMLFNFLLTGSHFHFDFERCLMLLYGLDNLHCLLTSASLDL